MSEKEKKPVTKQWWFAVIIVILGLGIIFSLGDNDSNTTTTSTNSVSITDISKFEYTIEGGNLILVRYKRK